VRFTHRGNFVFIKGVVDPAGNHQESIGVIESAAIVVGGSRLDFKVHRVLQAENEPWVAVLDKILGSGDRGHAHQNKQWKNKANKTKGCKYQSIAPSFVNLIAGSRYCQHG